MSKKDTIDPPYFEVCEECDRHGRIVAPGRGCSTEIVTKTEGIEWSEDAIRYGIINVEDLPALKRQIRVSTLPEDTPDLKVGACNTYGSGYFDDLVMEVFEKIPPAKCHYGNATSH